VGSLSGKKYLPSTAFEQKNGKMLYIQLLGARLFTTGAVIVLFCIKKKLTKKFEKS